MRFLERLQPLALLVMRLALGAIMIAHGWAKLSGGMKSTENMVSSIGFPWWVAYLIVAAEVGGGLLVVLGLLTRLGALAICLDLSVAIAKVNWQGGLRGPNGFEFPLACAALAFALIFFGGGPISLDSVLSHGGGPPKK